MLSFRKSSISIKTRIETCKSTILLPYLLFWVKVVYPLKQGLKQLIKWGVKKIKGEGKSSISIKTRIETFTESFYIKSKIKVKVVYPLKQGLKLF